MAAGESAIPGHDRFLEDCLFRSMGSERYTQNSPIMPGVWMQYRNAGSENVELLFTAHRDSNPGELARIIRQRLQTFRTRNGEKKPSTPVIAYNETSVVAEMSFDEMILVALPLSKWWAKYVFPSAEAKQSFEEHVDQYRDDLVAALEAIRLQMYEGERPTKSKTSKDQSSSETNVISANLTWMTLMVGVIRAGMPSGSNWDEAYSGTIADSFLELMREHLADSESTGYLLWSINPNRRSEPTLYRSVKTVKADATQTLFDVRGERIRWAVIDSGIDARHFAFRKRDHKGRALGPKINGRTAAAEFSDFGMPLFAPEDEKLQGAFVKKSRTRWTNQTRIVRSFDFQRMREILSASSPTELPEGLEKKAKKAGIRQELKLALKHNRVLDWELLEPLLEITHDDEYEPPTHHHGTHVAGIIGADWREGEHSQSPEGTRSGVAPAIEIYDLRALDQNGVGDEFSILAAMQYVRSLNARNNQMQIHGVNISISILHAVAAYGCGRTPICNEAERLVGSGVVVVAAAGNRGRSIYTTTANTQDEGYRDISITDPGNAEAVITVGSTHRYKPHSYGVSYFSSRGPTGDGRIKPDLVAPGEKIYSTIPNNDEKELDGTSMAAPHVSGAAALLMQRHNELIGQPERIKEILCDSATDLGRERYFQGAGMLDILRALQSV